MLFFHTKILYILFERLLLFPLLIEAMGLRTFFIALINLKYLTKIT
jgi:hypothetical protein